MIYEFVIDKKDYDGVTNRIIRKAARGIAFKGEKIILIKSDKFGELKFPGGGIHENESKEDALIREFKEETGIDVKSDSLKPFAIYKEIKKSTLYEEIFEQISFYYLVLVNDEIGNTNLDDYEKEYGYKLVFVSLDEAIANNENILKNYDISNCPWVERELDVLKKVKEVYDAIHS